MPTPRFTVTVRFSNGHIERKSTAIDSLTHAYRLAWRSNDGQAGDSYGFATSEASAQRAGLGMLKRLVKKHNYIMAGHEIEVVPVNEEIKRRDERSRFLKLFWKPKDMDKAWDRALHFKGRYLLVHETNAVWEIRFLGEDWKVSKATGEIIWFYPNGKRGKGGPIFCKTD